jgi:hypothetical protein
MNNICPACGKDDNIQKVSSITSLGTSTGQFSGTSDGITYSNGKIGVSSAVTSISGTNTTHLAQLLAAPRLPSMPSGPFFEKLFHFTVAFIGVTTLWVSLSSFSLIGILWGLVLTILPSINWKNIDKKHSERMKNWEEQRLRWSHAMEVWDSLYYCSRDDLVFNPNSRTKINPRDLQDYLYG